MQTKWLLVIATFLLSANSFANTLTNRHTIPESNFVTFNSGQEYCDYQMANNPNIKGCMPIYNTNHHTGIKVQLKENGPSQTIAAGMILPSYFFDNTESFNVIVTNEDSNKTIYVGPVYTIVGLACDDSSCKPWN
ncbi:hypothetical protein D5018_12215 [Parashewanella curva]|uniref:Adhesin n=1 Tax=Parashewanella curva TaxID=2338552 RepID=A0A3L8PVU3_9GAMM|nr:hypothetical protein [Parashewanella curva]RLV59456.1 hypothetical protein D5018_12215 [Parashewanella curva]